jgi:hypothetical protein
MGYRCTLCSNDMPGGKLPQWFKDKYEKYFLFIDGLTLTTKQEIKFYDNDFFEDYRKAIVESGYFDGFSDLYEIYLAVLGEDGAIYRVTINKYEIKIHLLSEHLETSEILTYIGNI